MIASFPSVLCALWMISQGGNPASALLSAPFIQVLLALATCRVQTSAERLLGRCTTSPSFFLSFFPSFFFLILLAYSSTSSLSSSLLSLLSYIPALLTRTLQLPLSLILSPRCGLFSFLPSSFRLECLDRFPLLLSCFPSPSHPGHQPFCVPSLIHSTTNEPTPLTPFPSRHGKSLVRHQQHPVVPFRLLLLTSSLLINDPLDTLLHDRLLKLPVTFYSGYGPSMTPTGPVSWPT